AAANLALCNCTPSSCMALGLDRMTPARGSIKFLSTYLAAPNNRFALVPWDQKVTLAAGQRAAGMGIMDNDNAIDSTDAKWIVPFMPSRPFQGHVDPLFPCTGLGCNTDGANGMLWAIRSFGAMPGYWPGGTAPNRYIIFMTDGVNTRFYNQPGGIYTAD